MISNANYDSTSRRKIELSRHANKRAQQRAIPQECVPLILAYGERTHDGQGGIRYLLTEKAMASLGRAIGHSQRLETLTGCYAVVSAEDEETIITVGHRYN
jgi:hypothetical protein